MLATHNYFENYTEKFIVIYGYIAIIYSLKLISNFLDSHDFKLHALIAYYVGLFGIGLYIFNIVFVENHILNIASVLMPLRYENIMILIYI